VITITLRGSFKKTEKFLKRMPKFSAERILEKYAKQGVDALTINTPQLTSLTAYSWNYLIEVDKEQYSITWTNDNLVDGVPVVILLQYGHLTGTGGYVQGYDFINPTLKPIFDKIADDVWREVKSA
jgi:hypothetical protein